MAAEITTAEFKTKVLTAEKPVLVDFFATWCGPCKMLAPVIAELADAHGEIDVYKVDIDKESDLASEYGVMSIPTLILFKNGEEAERTLGFQSKEDLEKTFGL